MAIFLYIRVVLKQKTIIFLLLISFSFGLKINALVDFVGTKYFYAVANTPQPGKWYYFAWQAENTLIYKNVDTIVFRHSRLDKNGNLSLGDTFTQIGKKVYLNEGEESTLFYDFDLRVGDTFRNGKLGDLVVEKVDSFKTPTGFSLKQFTFQSSIKGQFKWVENVGDIYTGLNYVANASWNYGYTSLALVCQNQSLLHYTHYFYDHVPGCDSASWQRYVSAEQLKKDEDYIFPNPTKDVLNVKIGSSFNYKIYNMNGASVLSGNGTSVIETASLPKGGYLLFLIDETAGLERRYRFVKE